MLFHLRACFPTPRFFPATGASRRMDHLKNETLHALLQKYPHLKMQKFSGEIVYVLRGESPEEAVKAGGFLPRNKSLWVASNGSGNSTGSICFSFLPEVAALFHASVVGKSPNKKAYLYAVPLHGVFVMPGGPWRQVLSPGAFPLPLSFRARELLGDCQNPDSPTVDRLRLGPLIGEGELTGPCPSFRDFMNTSEASLIKPKEFPTSDDVPQEFDIIDTEISARFQQETEEYYLNQLRRAHKP